jgi:threonine/homoserine/homoserine lactone efflux protein
LAFSILAAFWVLSISLVVTPGADWAYAISAGMHERAIAPAITGMLLGYLMITLIVAAGVGAIVASIPGVLTMLTFLGAGYLIWLGCKLFTRPSLPSAGKGRALNTWQGWVVRGFFISGMNPKAILLFVALLPQFTRSGSAWSIPAQITAMGVVQMLNCAVIYSLVGYSSKIVLSTRPDLARRVSQFSGIAMVAVAIFVLAM